jgi:uncharacterized protein YkwD
MPIFYPDGIGTSCLTIREYYSKLHSRKKIRRTDRTMMKNKSFQRVLGYGGMAALALLVSCAGMRQDRAAATRAQGTRPPLRIAQLEKEIHVLINTERKKRRLPALAWNDALSAIARKHSNDMAARNYFSHFSPEGHDFSYRYKQGGYSCALPGDGRIYLGAENIFQNNLYDRVVYVNAAAYYEWNTMAKIAETTVRGWMNSPGHRKNILTPSWRSEGIGVAISPDDKVYITENFC